MRTKTHEGMVDELQLEYDLPGLLRKGIRGKYSQKYREGTNLVLLEPDVAQAFPTGTSVNEALRLVMKLTKLPVSRKKLVHRA